MSQTEFRSALLQQELIFLQSVYQFRFIQRAEWLESALAETGSTEATLAVYVFGINAAAKTRVGTVVADRSRASVPPSLGELWSLRTAYHFWLPYVIQLVVAVGLALYLGVQ